MIIPKTNATKNLKGPAIKFNIMPPKNTIIIINIKVDKKPLSELLSDITFKFNMIIIKI